MIHFVIDGMVFIFLLWIVACVIKLIMGPSTADRLVALNLLSGLVLGLLVLIGTQKQSSLFLDVALVYDIFGFLGFLAIAKILEKHLKSYTADEE
ncbi:MAG TPA: monovalent cation/H+ antiporter complex subunit F [Spirochaetia bacterium]|nr:monovalent cation/H+ antiporter complex subunit F [Spirochaetales bacterium]HRS65125.1 monovalent cation/H+ antiporter complex subunit F [Spirochaetia bacterium]HOT58261.1 monovalent cation/H+ antiporter complex subunit F [Spirochaetales bacterium]HPD80348.1 monovalent cation/H+ antiporter complex subunit F [Spirochaetales bacterium]HQK34678.1 monovalent cation/H+ antiporter complex subunit F [Spirochaetales bacterium]